MNSKNIEYWRNFPAKQQPDYEDQGLLKATIADLKTRPPLVFAGEVDKLKQSLAQVGRGKSFVLTGGDCAETFAESTADRVRLKVQTILQMAIVLTYGASMPVIKLGRMAGQYAKPRSADNETVGGETLPSYRGDAVNSYEFSAKARQPDPRRLLDMYTRSGTSLNLIRAFTQGGYADLHHVLDWNRGFTKNPAYAKYEDLAQQISRAIAFMDASGINCEEIRTVDFYSAHEALLLEYESAMMRVDSRTGGIYNTSAHYLWIGERTRNPDEAHVQQLAIVRNPVGVKIGPGTKKEDLLRLIDVLNPDNEEGRLSFITRMGNGVIEQELPSLLELVKHEGRNVVWICDPMHGNTISATNGLKTRRFNDIMGELRGFFRVHEQVGTVPGGIHVELTGDDVTEVLGGAEDLTDEGLKQRYETLVDPRLNHQQSLELAFQVAQMLQRNE